MSFGREPNTPTEKIMYSIAWIVAILGFVWLTWYFLRGR
jgi:hypothetical protein